MKGMKIIEAGIKDINKLVLLFDAYRVFYKKESNIKECEDFLTNRITHGESIVYIAVNENRDFMGFTQLYPLFSSTRVSKMWLLNDLFVDDKYRGLGVSKLLIEKAKTLVKETGACELILETEQNNLVANKLYEATGFKKDIEHNFYAWP